MPAFVGEGFLHRRAASKPRIRLQKVELHSTHMFWELFVHETFDVVLEGVWSLLGTNNNDPCTNPQPTLPKT